MVNRAILIGNLGADPEVRTVGDTEVANFTIATTRKWKDKNGEKVEKTDWHNIVMWRGLAGVAKRYLKKGMRVYISGRIENRSYEDKEGITRYISEVIADEMQMLSYNDDKQGSKPKASDKGTYVDPLADDSDDLPF